MNNLVIIIDKAIDKALNFLKKEGIYNYTRAIQKRINEWALIGGVEDVDTLAALGLSIDYENDLTKEEINYIKEFYFPNEAFIENALF